MDAFRVAVAVLSGGAGRRLGGREKGLALLDGKPLIEHVLAQVDHIERFSARHCVIEQRLVVANRHHDAYLRHAPTIADLPDAGAGPLAGIASALAHCRSDWLLTLPVDCVTPPLDLLSRFAGTIRTTGADVAVAHDGTRIQPLFAVYRTSLAASALAAARHGQGPRQWQQSLSLDVISFADTAEAFGNLNTPEAFSNWRPAGPDGG